MYESPKYDILEDKNRGVGRARNVLARLFRQMLRDLNIDGNRWHRLMLRYLADPRNRIPANGKDKSSARGNLNKELRRDTMTWKVFHDKAISFLNPLKIEFIVKATWANGKTTVHELKINRDEYELDTSEEPEDEQDGQE